MKKAILIVSCLVFLHSVAEAEEIELPHVTVHGTATKQVKPDQMIWALQIQNTGMDIEDVASEHTKAVQQVLGFLKDSEVAEADTQTSGMRFKENWERRDGSLVKEGYYATTEITFQVNDTSAYESLWLGLSKCPKVTVKGVYFDYSERIKTRNEMRAEAVLAAKEKATALAETLGSRIAEPLLIEEEFSPSYGRSSAYSNFLQVEPSEEEGDAAGLAPGRIAISARVQVAFRLVSPGD